MRVVHVVPSLDAHYGGPAVSVPSLAHAMEQAGIQTILCSVDAHANNALIESQGLKWRRARPSALKRGYFSRDIGRVIDRAISEIDADIVHVHSLWSYPTLVAYRIARRRGLKFVISPRSEIYAASLRRGRFVKALALGTAWRSVVKGADLVHATEPSEEQAAIDLNFGGKRVLAPNGIDTSIGDDLPSRAEARAALGLDPNRRLALYLARLHPRKGLDKLIAAWNGAGLAEQGWDCVVAGGGAPPKYLRQIQRLVEGGAQPGSVKFLGHLDNERKRLAYAACDVYVLPTQFENFGLSIAEALACRRPVITTEATPWQALTDGAGWIVPVDDVAALEGALRQAAGPSEDALAAMGEAGGELVKELSWESSTKTIIQAYGSL